jgi:FAD binding domain
LGANTGIQDGYNLGWKLGLVVRGRADVRLLASYQEERHAIAQKLMRTNKQAEALLIPGTAPGSAPWVKLLHRHLIMPATNVYGVVDLMLHAVDQTQVSYRGRALSRDWPWPPWRGLAAGDRAPDNDSRCGERRLDAALRPVRRPTIHPAGIRWRASQTRPTYRRRLPRPHHGLLDRGTR